MTLTEAREIYKSLENLQSERELTWQEQMLQDECVELFFETPMEDAQVLHREVWG